MEALQINLHHSKVATAALSQKILSEGIQLVFIQEPWVVKGRVMGLGATKGKLIYDAECGRPRACLYISNNINSYKLNSLCSRDTATAEVRISSTRIVLASVYLPYDAPEDPPTPDMRRAVDWCIADHRQLIIGGDFNAHNTVWGSTDTNSRGEYILDYILSTGLIILNSGNKPTFQQRRGQNLRQEVLDLTLATRFVATKVTQWRVADEPSLSDHNYISFKVGHLKPGITTYRNPRRTDWQTYESCLETNLVEGFKKAHRIDVMEQSLTDAIRKSYEEACPPRQIKTRTNASWWNRELEAMRVKVRKLYNASKRSGSREAYLRELTLYTSKIKQAKRNSWREFCEGVNETPDCAKLQRVLAKNPIGTVGSITKEDGSYTTSPEETLQVLLSTHFPGSMVVPESTQETHVVRKATKEDWECSKTTITYNGVAWAVNSFQPYKSPGPDGVYPVLLQKGAQSLIPRLLALFRTSLATGEIPTEWKRSRAVFIPKPGRPSYSVPKAYRPICLSSFLLKTMEKILDRHLRNVVLKFSPLHPNQHAYQTGKSCETALHQLVGRIEKSITHHEIALAAFLDIEGAFDNTSSRSIIARLESRNVKQSIVRWVNNVLRCRRVEASLCGETRKVSAPRGCPQGGALSPLLWCLVVDDLLVELNSLGIFTQSYADDIVILISGKHISTCLELMQDALTRVERWCRKEELSVNPSKTVLLPFTNKRTIQIERCPQLFGEDIRVALQFKYLGVVLDAKLTWNPHVEKAAKKSLATFMMTRRAFSCTWGLNPAMVNWLYTGVIRPSLVYGAGVWWPKVQQKTAVKHLTKVQRAVCLGITGAMKSTSTDALQAILNIPPIDLFVMGHARMTAYRLQCEGNWFHSPSSRHTKITNVIQLDVTEMIPDKMTVIMDLEKPYEVEILQRDEWAQGEPEYLKHALTWYTDGSKTSVGTGAGIYGARPREKLWLSLGKIATVFQAEVTAIRECVRRNVDRKYKKKTIYIASDSRAALLALRGTHFRSKLVWECHNALKNLSTDNTVKLVWVPGHQGIQGNEEADKLAKHGAESPLTGPEPACGVSYSLVKRAVSQWITTRHCDRWSMTEHSRQTRRMLKRPSEVVAAQALKLNRKKLREVVGYLTGHWTFRKHLKRMGLINSSTLCRLCGEDDESAQHLIFDCAALTRRRTTILEIFTDEGMVNQGQLIRRVSEFTKNLGLDDA